MVLNTAMNNQENPEKEIFPTEMLALMPIDDFTSDTGNNAAVSLPFFIFGSTNEDEDDDIDDDDNFDDMEDDFDEEDDEEIEDDDFEDDEEEDYDEDDDEDYDYEEDVDYDDFDE